MTKAETGKTPRSSQEVPVLQATVSTAPPAYLKRQTEDCGFQLNTEAGSTADTQTALYPSMKIRICATRKTG